MEAQHRPLRIAKHDNSDVATRQVLLITDILIRGQEDVEAGCLSGVKQISIAQRIPAQRFCIFDSVVLKNFA